MKDKVYIDYIEGKIGIILDEISSILRNFEIKKEEINKYYGFFTDNFYSRSDISECKLSRVKVLNNELEYIISNSDITKEELLGKSNY